MDTLGKAIAGCIALAGCVVAAQAQRPAEIVKWNASITKSTATAETVALAATIQDGWHVYALSQPPGGPTPLKISVPTGNPFTVQGQVAEGKVTRHDDPNFKMETLYYLNTVSLNVPVKKEETVAAGTPVPVDVRFQACNDRLCLPPYTAHLTATPKGK